MTATTDDNNETLVLLIGEFPVGDEGGVGSSGANLLMASIITLPPITTNPSIENTVIIPIAIIFNPNSISTLMFKTFSLSKKKMKSKITLCHRTKKNIYHSSAQTIIIPRTHQ